MSAQDGFEDKLLSLIITNVAATNVGDAPGLLPSAAPGSYFVGLQTVTIIEATSNQTTNEAAYTGYARQGVARSVAGWTVLTGLADNDAIIGFPIATAGSETELDFHLGFAISGVGEMQMSGVLNTPLAVSVGVKPEFPAGGLDITLD